MKANPNIKKLKTLIFTSVSLSIASSLVASVALPSIPAAALTDGKSHAIKIAKKLGGEGGSSAGAANAHLTEDEQVNIRVYKAANRAVVNIMPVASAEDTLMNPNSTGKEGFGSGAIISPEGYILTNNHVVEGFQNVRVTIWDGTNLHGTVVGVDPQTDIAVVKIDPPKGVNLTVLPFGDSAQMEVGRKVLAIGNPFGLDRTMTDGIVSSVGRTMNTAQGARYKRHHTDRRCNQSGQLRRPIARFAGQNNWHQYGYCQYHQAVGRDRLRHSHKYCQKYHSSID